MPKLLSATALACALTLLTCCQLNDRDSAPRAPDLGEEEDQESIDPATLGTANTSSGAGDVPSTDSGVAGGQQLPAITNDAALPAAFLGLDASSSSPVLPVLPGLEAGTLPPASPGP